MRTSRISKALSANDTGETGGHQAGMLIPKSHEILSFFPRLDPAAENPRSHLIFTDEGGQRWEFAFIYYNNHLRGGTRNEYRLTRMTKYIRERNLEVGDDVVLSRDESGKYHVSYQRQKAVARTATGALKLGTGWRVVNF